MQFAATNVEPSPNSKVTVTFAGLMLLRPGAYNTLEVGIHKFNRDHTFQVMLIVNKPQRPPRVIRLLAGPLFSDFEMIVDQPGAGIQKFVASEDEFDRSNEENNPLDFRWSFNLQALPGHEQVDINDGAKPIAKLNSGVLYTPNLTRKGLDPRLVSGFDEFNLHQFSADLGASVELPAGAKMTLKWTELGEPQEIVLPRDPPDPDGTTYTVALLNDPVISDPPAHDELKEYYKVLTIENQEIPEDMQCRIVVPPNHKSDEIPCLAGVLEKPGTH